MDTRTVGLGITGSKGKIMRLKDKQSASNDEIDQRKQSVGKRKKPSADTELYDSGRGFDLQYTWPSVDESNAATSEQRRQYNESYPALRLQAVLNAIDAFRGLVEPLAADLTVRCLRLDDNTSTWLESSDTEPQSSYWQLRQPAAALPDHVLIEEEYNDSVIQYTPLSNPALSRAALTAWIQLALAPNQCSRDPCCRPYWKALRIAAVRVRLVDDTWRNRTAFHVQDDLYNIFELPIERRPDGLWVSGPMQSHRYSPPVRIKFGGYYGVGWLNLHIDMPWEMWGGLSDTSEGTALHSVLKSLLKQGWEIDDSSSRKL